MKLKLSKPILYLITRGATDKSTTPASFAFQHLLLQISTAVDAGIQFIQLREKKLTARVLFEMTERAVDLARGTATRILVNDRADIAAAAGADGVHLTTQSLEAMIVRKTFGDDFLIGASTHSLAEARAARDGSADFVVFGPVFATRSKEYGPPAGLERLKQVTKELQQFPVLALGGITAENAVHCLRAGASGIAGISLFSIPGNLQEVVAALSAGKGVRDEQ